MGAIRPPWISKKWFYKTPFNYCDRWCEKCSLTEVCPVYKKEQERKIRHIKEGKNPYSWECVFEDVKETLEETKKLIKKQAKKEGIDLKKAIKNENFQEPPEPEIYPLYNLTFKFSSQIHLLLKNFEIVPADIDVERIKDDLEVLSFYQFFIAVKVDRAYSSKFYEENDPEDETMDSKTSAFLAHHALEKMGLALLNLSYQKPLSKLKKRFLTLAKTSLNLAEVVSEEFLT